MKAYVTTHRNNSLRANPTKWSNILKQLVRCCRQIVLSVTDHFVKLALKGIIMTAA